MSINMVYMKKIEDTLICTNDTDCNESIDLTIQNLDVDDSALEALASSNDTEQTTTTISIETTSSETTSKINFNVTDQPELQSTSTTISSTTVAVPLNDNGILSFKKNELCECDLIVCILYFY